MRKREIGNFVLFLCNIKMHSIFSMVRFEVALCVSLSVPSPLQSGAHCSYATDTDTESETDSIDAMRCSSVKL